jgi:hypothetical protein
MIPRNVRDNNPGNINAGQPWQGQMPSDQMTPEQRAETRFAVFQTPAWGFRALIRDLNAYIQIHGLRTVRQIITRYAPDTENNTNAYVLDTAARLRVKPDDPLPWPESARDLAKAITTHETGSWEPWWNDADLDQGVSLAGL